MSEPEKEIKLVCVRAKMGIICHSTLQDKDPESKGEEMVARHTEKGTEIITLFLPSSKQERVTKAVSEILGRESIIRILSELLEDDEDPKDWWDDPFQALIVDISLRLDDLGTMLQEAKLKGRETDFGRQLSLCFTQYEDLNARLQQYICARLLPEEEKKADVE